MTSPAADVDSAPWWDALREHRVVLQRCEVCSKRRFPRVPSCPWCGTPGGVDDEVDARGRVYSWIVVHRALTGTHEVPYTVAVVELEGGPRLLGRLEGAPGNGVEVEPFFVEHDDWTELRFRVTT